MKLYSNSKILILIACGVLSQLAGCNRQSTQTPKTTPKVAKQTVTSAESASDEQVAPITDKEVAAIIAWQKQLDERLVFNPPKIPGGLKQIPKWLQDDLPFDLDSLNIPDEDNGEQAYYVAMLKNDFSDNFALLPELVAQGDVNVEDRPAEIKAAYKLYRRIWDAKYVVLDDIYEGKKLEGEMLRQAKLVADSLETVIVCLRAAQSKPNTFFHRPFRFDSNETVLLAGREFGRTILIAANSSEDTEVAIDLFEILLRTERDLRTLESYIGQLNCRAANLMAFQDILRPLLKRTLSNQQLDRTISIIRESLKAEETKNRFMQAIGYEYIAMRQLFHELETGIFKMSDSTFDYLSIPKDCPAILQAHNTLVLLEIYRTNDEEVKKTIEQTSASSPEIKQKADELLDSAKSNPISGAQVASAILTPVIFAEASGLTAEQFDFENSILKKRYADCQTAIALPFEQRSKAIEHLSENWTLDDSWKKTKFLKFYKPHEHLAGLDTRSRVVAAGYLTLVALKKWQLNHEGALPKDVSEALAYAKITEKVNDPYSSKPFKILPKESAVYSVGTNGVDDGHKNFVTPDDSWVGGAEILFD